MDWSTIITNTTFSPILTSIETVMPFVIAFSVSLIGIRKVWGFVKGSIKRA